MDVPRAVAIVAALTACGDEQPPRPAAAAVASTTATLADVAARVTPSVVNVFSERSVSVAGAVGESPFERFLHGPDGGLRQRGLGSGVIVSADGVILTSNHVIAAADTIRVGLQDGRELEARIVGTDPESDVAVLRVDAAKLPAIEKADSSRIRIGDTVLAIGNPFGIGQTVTMGIISAVGRADIGILDDEDFLQTDAAINPGNSGGALVDMTGRLVGINTAIASRSGGFQGVGFAIPSNVALHVVAEILEHGKVTRSFLGITVEDARLPGQRGAAIVGVTPGGPAARAGLEDGDVITAIDGRPVTSSTQLRTAVALAGVGVRVRLDLVRDGEPRTQEVELAEQPSGHAEIDSGTLSGLTVRALDAESRERFAIPDIVQGVLVAHVAPDSTAANLGLVEGDVIIAANHELTLDAGALRRAAGVDERRILLLVCRGGTVLLLAVTD